MIRIKDIADELGLSTATVSNVIHGKTKKISKETVKRVQALLEEKEYIPNMAAILLAQNSSKIICLVISAHEKYERRLLQDPFIAALADDLSYEIESHGYFMMIKRCKEISEVVRYASMWNMAGLVLTGFCNQDYNELRQNIRIPFVVMDGFFEPQSKCANIGIDNIDGGFQVGRYLMEMGHRNILYIADNDEDMDHERYVGLKKAVDEINLKKQNKVSKQGKVQFQKVSIFHEERMKDYEKVLKQIGQITAIFCASDAYAIELIGYLIDHHIKIPEAVSIVGFDDIPEANSIRPRLTTVRQDIGQRARKALEFLDTCEEEDEKNFLLPVKLIERESVCYNQRDKNKNSCCE
ncbi:MAG: LacI family transcriptional regulator [Cellulosilyticum sp.]|nr:LacI family transcriptional regulator [Cellulosilyticum sp.]